MFEMTVSTVKAKSADITFIIDKIRPNIKSLRGLMVCEELDGRTKLAVAVEESKRDYCLSLLFDAIAEAIIRGYKEEYLKQRIKLKVPAWAFESFIKALVMFDKSVDKQIIYKKLHPARELNLDSLYNFRLWELTKHWQEICALVGENSHLLSDGTFAELMRFLLLSGEAESGQVRVFSQGDSILGRAENGEELFRLANTKDEGLKSRLLGELISLAPERIVLEEGVSPELCQLIDGLFDGKVVRVQKKC